MNWIKEIAFHKGIRNELPNKELAEKLSESNNKEGIKEIADYLYDRNKSIASDCLAVLYTVGYTKPELIQDYAGTFLKLLDSKNNRMVWGSMIALSTIAHLQTKELSENIELILNTIKRGTLITEVWGIKTLVNLSLQSLELKLKLLPVLFDYLEKCRPIDFATRLETIQPVIADKDEEEIFANIVEMKRTELSESQAKKVDKILRK